MPRKPIDYSKTIMYKIVCKDLLVTKCYVGHTINFINRKCGHKTKCNNKNDKLYNSYVYTHIREYGGWENWEMIEIEKYPCLDVNEAHKRERYWIETLNAELNQFIPARTIEEKKEYNKEWIKNNIEERTEYMKIYNKEYREINIDKLKETDKIKSKIYRENNKQKEYERHKKYQEENRDKINKKRRERRALKKQQSIKEDA